MNYYLEDLCSFCLSILNEKFRDRSQESPDKLTHFDKIKTTLIELSSVMETDSRICRKCSEAVDFIYDFNKTCLKNINILNSYKTILKESLSKRQCDLYVNLSKSNQYNENLTNFRNVNLKSFSENQNDDMSNKTDFISEENLTNSAIVKIEPLDNDDNMFCESNSILENYRNETVDVKEEIEMKCESNETFETCWLVPDIKVEVNEIHSEEEPLNEIHKEPEDESFKPNIQDIELAATTSVNAFLPAASMLKYEQRYKLYVEWCLEKKIKNICKEKVLLEYFEYLINKNYKPTSIWAFYTMLRTLIVMKHHVDISKYSQLFALLKRQSQGYQPEKKIFKKEDIIKFLTEANDEKFLLTKVVLIIGLAGACRKAELINIQINNVKEEGDSIRVIISKTGTNRPREFNITSGNIKNINLIEIVKKYLRLRPNNVEHNRLFVSYRRGKCTKQPVGINSIGAMTKQIATFLNLPEPHLYTGHCFRRSSSSWLVDSGANLLEIKCQPTTTYKISGHQNPQSQHTEMGPSTSTATTFQFVKNDSEM